MKTVVVEGWRFVPHSYAVVAQALALEMARRGDVRVFFREAPLAFAAWKAEAGVLGAEDEARLRAIPPPPPGEPVDAVLRVVWPHYFHRDLDAGETFTWATSETLRVEDSAMGVRRPAREVLPRAETRVIACSGWAAEGFVNSGLPAERVSVAPCGVDPRVHRPAAGGEREKLRKKLGWEGKLVVLNVSAMTENKGVGLLLRAAGRLAGEFPALAVVLKGADSLYRSESFVRTALSGLSPAEQRAVAPRMSYFGKTVAARDMADLYRAADLYVSPYLAEGFNLPVLEAGANGCPVVCTAGGSTEDFVDGSWVWKVTSTLTEGARGAPRFLRPDPESLVGLMRGALADEGARKEKGAAGAAWARERFTWGQGAEKVLGVMFPGMG